MDWVVEGRGSGVARPYSQGAGTGEDIKRYDARRIPRQSGYVG